MENIFKKNLNKKLLVVSFLFLGLSLYVYFFCSPTYSFDNLKTFYSYLTVITVDFIPLVGFIITAILFIIKQNRLITQDDLETIRNDIDFAKFKPFLKKYVKTENDLTYSNFMDAYMSYEKSYKPLIDDKFKKARASFIQDLQS